MVTFETPLIFSRSSSIASLGSCEPQEGFIDSSAISECRYRSSYLFLLQICKKFYVFNLFVISRVTSGLVTPSEIPDSPTSTVPPSPPCFKSNYYQIQFKLHYKCYFNKNIDICNNLNNNYPRI